MIRYRYKGAKLLFVGINPHHGSYERGVPFSNNKMFWYLLARAGVLWEEPERLKEDGNLRTAYLNWFGTKNGLGFVNLINRPTRDVTLLEKGEERQGKARASRIFRTEHPRVICFIGKIAYEKFSGTKDFGFGWQNDIGSSRVFVMHFPLRGPAGVRVQELREVAKIAGIPLGA